MGKDPGFSYFPHLKILAMPQLPFPSLDISNANTDMKHFQNAF